MDGLVLLDPYHEDRSCSKFGYISMLYCVIQCLGKACADKKRHRQVCTAVGWACADSKGTE